MKPNTEKSHATMIDDALTSTENAYIKWQPSEPEVIVPHVLEQINTKF